MTGRRERRWVGVIVFLAIMTTFLPTMIRAEEFGIIRGRILDKVTGEPLPGVNIIVKGRLLGASSGIEGEYSIPNITPGSYRIVATMIGYRSEYKDIEISGGETHQLDFELVETVIEMDGIVVTGTRTPRYIKDVPVRTEVITHQRMVDKGATTLYEALQGEPGIRIEQQCSACNFSMIRMQGLKSDHVQIMINGKSTFAGLPSVFGLQQIPVANIERVEVVKGAGSALHGAGAIAGVVNIITKRPGYKPSANLTMRLGEHNTNLFSLGASYRLDNMDIALSAQKNTGDEIDEDGDKATDRVKTDNMATGVEVSWYNLLGNDQIRFSGSTINETRRGGDLTDNLWYNPFAAGSEKILTTRYEATIGYEKRFIQGNEFGIGFTYAKHNRNATNDAFFGDYEAIHGTVPPVDLMRPYIADGRIYILDINYAHPIGKHRLLAGVQYHRDEMEESGMYCIIDSVTIDGVIFEPGYTYQSTSEKHADNFGAYLQGEFPVRTDLELVLGVRYDFHSSEDNFGGSGDVALLDIETVKYEKGVFNPRAAIRFQPLENLVLRGSVGTGFRVPYSFSEDLHLCSGSPRVLKPKGLESENSMGFNLSADYSTLRYTISAGIFRTNLQNKISFADADDEQRSRGFDFKWENIGDAYTQGIELGSRLLLRDDLILDATFTYTDAQYEENRCDFEETPYYDDSKYISRVPSPTANIGVEWRPGNWSMVANVDYTGIMYIDYFGEEPYDGCKGIYCGPGEGEGSIKHTDPFYVVNARIAKNIPGTGANIFLGARNLTDYTQEDRRPDDAAFMYAPFTGRIVYGGIGIRI